MTLRFFPQTVDKNEEYQYYLTLQELEEFHFIYLAPQELYFSSVSQCNANRFVGLKVAFRAPNGRNVFWFVYFWLTSKPLQTSYVFRVHGKFSGNMTSEKNDICKGRLALFDFQFTTRFSFISTKRMDTYLLF